MSTNVTQQYLRHLESIIQMYEDASQATERNISERAAYGIATRARSAIEKISGKQSYYAKQVEEIMSREWSIWYQAELITGIAEALRKDILDGYLDSLTELARGELFNDFLEMSDYLLKEGYKDAAAVIAGSALEAHLRRLCNKNGIDTEHKTPDGGIRSKKAAQLNQELGKSVYSLFDQKQITAWLDLRNSAAHGNYSAYTPSQVAQLIQWTQDFISKKPA